VDLEIIVRVGWALYTRCETILQVTAAHDEVKITCPTCGAVFVRNVEIDMLSCVCGWEVAWEAYHRTYHGRQHYAANAFDVFSGYARDFPKLSDPQFKMVAIDQLLHKFHLQLKETTLVIGRPAASNLIKGNLREVCAFLDALSSENPDLAGSQTAWRETFHRADWSENFPIHSGDENRRNRN